MLLAYIEGLSWASVPIGDIQCEPKSLRRGLSSAGPANGAG